MPIQYVPFYPDPIEGQALLNNFTRTRRALSYRDNDKPTQRILRGMPLYEVDKVEQAGENPNGNLVIRGECLSACAYLKAQGIQVDLVYIDPPFASGANYAKKIYLRRNPKAAQAIEQAEREMDDEALRAFEETMYGDIWTKEAYLNWMYENLMAIKSVMSPTASIYVHLDWHIGHYVKVLMDEIFGEDNFRNEIVVKRVKKSVREREKVKALNVATDSIYFYALDESVTILPPVKPSRKEERWHSFDAPEIRTGMDYEIFGHRPPPGRHWMRSKDVAEEWIRQGKLRPNPNTGKPEYLLDATEDMLCDSLWDDITAYSFSTDYDTEKNESLLRRIIEASSNAGMVVADFFGGSGVTAKVAHDLGRRFIHVDVGINSIQTTRDRLVSAGASFDILEVRDGVALFRNPAQTMEKLAALIPGLGKAEGLASFWAGAIQDGKDGMTPVYLPNLLDHREKLLDLPLLNRIVNEQIPDLPDGVKKVIVYYVDIEDEKAAKDFLREYGNPLVEVELRDLKAVLHEIVLNDEVEYTLTEAADGWQVEITRFYSDRLAQKIDAHNQKLRLNAKGKKKARQIALEEAENGEEPAPANFSPIEISETGLELIELISLDCTAAEGVWHSDSEIKIDKKGFVIRDGVKTKEVWDGAITSARKPLRLKIRNIAGDETVVRVE
ncbi:MAG: site-specific DNA-methyltransferase [Chloroflexota bacterium]|jgi:adenine-specific DNA-methyltransferase